MKFCNRFHNLSCLKLPSVTNFYLTKLMLFWECWFFNSRFFIFFSLEEGIPRHYVAVRHFWRFYTFLEEEIKMSDRRESRNSVSSVIGFKLPHDVKKAGILRKLKVHFLRIYSTFGMGLGSCWQLFFRFFANTIFGDIFQ